MEEGELGRAERLVQEGDLDGARAVAEALAAREDSPGAHNVLGYIAYGEGRLLDAERAFAHACSLPGADEDARANLEAVRAALAAAAPEQPEPAPEPAAPPPRLADFAATYEDLVAGSFGPDLSPRLLGRLLAHGLGPGLEARLGEIPTATSAEERRFLLRYAARLWDGQGDVFENGPLLGGTTRALAYGMLAHEGRRPDALLHTHDWFSSRVALDLPADTFDAMVAHGLITPEVQREMEASGSFQALYDALHSGHEYSPLIRSHEAYLPGHRGEATQHGEAIFEPPDTTFSLVFVDGCKSWFGTKFWLERMCERIPAGAHLIFQDYGWYSCFWLPALTGLLEGHFRLVAYIHDTYAFELLRPIDPRTLADRYPDQPEDLDRGAYDDLFTKALMQAGANSDIHAMICLNIQHAAALAYIGHEDEARHRIEAMRGRPEFETLRARFIENALRSPTYRPDGTSVEL